MEAAKSMMTCLYKPTLYDMIFLFQCFAEWLVPLTENYQSLPADIHLKGAVFVVWCLFRLKIPLNNYDVKAATPALLRLLSKSQSSVDEQSQWEEYNLLSNFISTKKHRCE